MKIKTAFKIIVILFLIGAGFKIYQYFNKPTPSITVILPDSTASPITYETYRPQSIPIIEKAKKPKVKLPASIKEDEVERVITIVKSPDDTTHIIFPANDEEPYINKQGGKVLSVTITEFLPPILAWDWYFKIGLTANSEKVSPAIGLSFLRFYGKLDLPVFILDVQGVGLGADYKLYKRVGVGVNYHNSWQREKAIKLNLNWRFN